MRDASRRVGNTLRAFPKDEPLYFFTDGREEQHSCRAMFESSEGSRVFIVGGIEDGAWMYTVVRIETPELGLENEQNCVATRYAVSPIHASGLLLPDGSMHMREYVRRVQREVTKASRGDITQIVVRSTTDQIGRRVDQVTSMHITHTRDLFMTPSVTNTLGQIILADMYRQPQTIFDFPGHAIKNDIRIQILV